VNDRPRPFLKWAGGKGRLLVALERRIPEQFGAYHEPFLGGAALYFHLAGAGRIRTALLSDINEPLVEAYLGVQQETEAVMGHLAAHARDHDREHYYAVRDVAAAGATLAERAARVIYLNRTCYNGLYRENRAGRFNVPMGRYTKPRICDRQALLAAAAALQAARIESRPFTDVLDRARPGDLVYLDPPYVPLSASASFTSYHRAGFGPRQQEVLRDVFAALVAQGVAVILSNSDTPRVRSLYSAFPCDRVRVARPINSRASSRGVVAEVIIHSTPSVP
jgi:DNA adenine methylase